MNLFYLLDDINYIGDNFCETKEVLSVIRMVGYILLIAKLIAPIIIIVIGTLKFYNAIKDGSSDSTLKNAKSLIVRVFVGIIIFFLPTLIHAVLYNFISDDSKKCEVCLLQPGSCDPGDPGSIDTSNGNVSQTGSGNTGSGNTGSGNTGSGNTGSGNTSVPNCPIRKASKKYCESEKSCEWDETNKTCDYKDTKENCEYKCSSQYTSGTKAHFDCMNNCSSKGTVDYSKTACLDIPASSCLTQLARCKILIDVNDENNGKCVDINYDKCSTNSEANCTGICQWKNGKCQMFDFSLNACDLVTEKDKCTGKCEWSNNSCVEKDETVIKDCSSYDILGCPTDYCKQDIISNKCVNK